MTKPCEVLPYSPAARPAKLIIVNSFQTKSQQTMHSSGAAYTPFTLIDFIANANKTTETIYVCVMNSTNNRIFQPL
jgi:hypothetical protein